MRRAAIVFLTLFLLWGLVAQANHALSEAHVYLFAGGLFVTYSALTLRLRDGMIVTFLGGLLCDTSLPLPPDLGRLALGLAHTHALLFVCAHAIVYYLRARIPREETVARVLVALFSNLGIFIVFSFVQAGHSPAPAQLWPRLIVDLACSQVFLALVAPWFFALQGRAIAIAGLSRDNLAGSA